MNPNEARTTLAEIARTQARTRRAGRWAAWLWLATGMATGAFELLAPPITHGWAEALVTLGFPVIGALLLGAAWRERVHDLVAARLAGPVTAAFITGVLIASAFRFFTAPTDVTPTLLIVACLPFLPCAYAAVRVARG